MNYFALGGGIFALLIALHLTSGLMLVAVGKARFTVAGSLTVRAAAIAIFGTLAAWLFGMVGA